MSSVQEFGDVVSESSFASLKRHIDTVLDSEDTIASRSGRWEVRLEYSGDGLGPAAGEFDEFVVRESRGYHRGGRDVIRWPLDEVPEDAAQQAREAAEELAAADGGEQA